MTVTRIENSVAAPNARTLRSLAKALGIAPPDLLTPTPESHLIDRLVEAANRDTQGKNEASRQTPEPVLEQPS